LGEGSNFCFDLQLEIVEHNECGGIQKVSGSETFFQNRKN
jgi:hypothetical protein